MEAAKGRGTGTTPARLLDPEQFEQAGRRIWPLPPKDKDARLQGQDPRRRQADLSIFKLQLGNQLT